MKYKGSCHCGKISFEAEGEIKEVMSCNCSMCQRKGSLLWALPRDTVRLSADAASTYTFNKHVIKHRFCPTCGIHTHAEGVGRDGKPMTVINARCIEDIDLASIPVKQFDGRSL